MTEQLPSEEKVRSQFRKLQSLWLKARDMQDGAPDRRRDGDGVHAEALALENDLVSKVVRAVACEFSDSGQHECKHCE
jgi:hypothetical protein